MLRKQQRLRLLNLPQRPGRLWSPQAPAPPQAISADLHTVRRPTQQQPAANLALGLGTDRAASAMRAESGLVPSSDESGPKKAESSFLEPIGDDMARRV